MRTIATCAIFVVAQVNREKVKLDWLKSRFQLIQAELERNPTLYYVRPPPPCSIWAG